MLGVQRLTLITCYAKVALLGQDLIPPSAAHAVIAVLPPRCSCMSDPGYIQQLVKYANTLQHARH